jgi:hypothetical protein
MATWTEVIFTKNMAVLSDDDPTAVDTAAAPGNDPNASRGDHVHDIAAGAINAEAMFAAGAVGATNLADDCVASDQLKAFTGNIDFNGQIATDFVFENKSTAAKPVGVIGKMYYDTTLGKVRVCTVAA